jgi:ribonuclease BN (tRNA processing enzyme)
VLLMLGSHQVVVDLGYGALSRLMAVLGGDAAKVDAVVVTHAHPDHLVDVHGLYRARRFATVHRDAGPRLPLFAPSQVMQTLAAIDPEDPRGPSQVLDFTPLPGEVVVGPWRLTAVATPHHVPNVAVRFDAPAGSFVYTGDTALCPQLEQLASGCDLLLCEATDRTQQRPESPEDPLLMTSAAAGHLAREANVGQLVLTHFWPGNDRERSRQEAMQEYGGPVALADERSEQSLAVRLS